MNRGKWNYCPARLYNFFSCQILEEERGFFVYFFESNSQKPIYEKKQTKKISFFSGDGAKKQGNCMKILFTI